MWKYVFALSDSNTLGSTSPRIVGTNNENETFHTQLKNIKMDNISLLIGHNYTVDERLVGAMSYSGRIMWGYYHSQINIICFYNAIGFQKIHFYEKVKVLAEHV